MMRADEVNALFAQGLRHHQSGQLAEAQQIYTQILRAEPGHADSLHLLGVITRQNGRADLAVALIDKAIEIDGRVAAYHSNRGNALLDCGRQDEAIAAFERALELDPAFLQARHNLGTALHAAGHAAAAETAFVTVLRQRPDYAEARANLARLRLDAGRVAEASMLARTSIACAPSLATPYGIAGQAFSSSGDPDGAVAVLRRMVKLTPGDADAWHNLAGCLREGGDFATAVSACQTAILLSPGLEPAYREAAAALTTLGRAGSAATALNHARSAAPDSGEAWLAATMASIPLFPDTIEESAAAPGHFLDALPALERWADRHLERLGEAIGATTPFYLAYRPGNPREALSRFGDLASRAAAARWGSFSAPAAPANRRVKLAIVTAHARRHPVWDMVLKGVLAQLDRDRFEILLCHTRPERDAETDWAVQRGDAFLQGPMNTDGWLEHLRAFAPDILFYPEIGMDPATFRLASLRLAPLQAAGWGHPVTSGLPTIDLYFSGELLEGPNAAEHYREKLILLPGTGTVTDPSLALAETAPLPVELPDDGAARLGICQVAFKLDPAFDPLIADVVERIGRCQLLVAVDRKFPWATERFLTRLRRLFEERGVAGRVRLIPVPWMSPARFAAFLDAIDVYLDCPSFSGYTTAWQALHRGTPVVTLEGRFLRQRLAAGLLRRIGHEELVATDPAGYGEIAARLAQESGDPARRQARRAEIKSAASLADAQVDAAQAFAQELLGAFTAGPTAYTDVSAVMAQIQPDA